MIARSRSKPLRGSPSIYTPPMEHRRQVVQCSSSNMTPIFLLLVVFHIAIATPIEDVKNVVEEVRPVEKQEVVDVENKVQDSVATSPQIADRIDENLQDPSSINEDVVVSGEGEDVVGKNQKEDLETANTFWGGYYRSPSWGWRRGWGGGGYGGYGGYYYPSYRNYGWGGRGYYNGGGWGWGNNRGGWGGYYW